MTEKLGDISAKFKAAAEPELMQLIDQYKADERSGVCKLIESANKRLQAYEAEKERVYRMLEFERKYADHAPIAGLDEAGRGPLAGPVVAAAVILKPNEPILYVNDSKKLSEKKREALFDEIMEKAAYVGVGVIDRDVIDEINILQADYEAMRMALSELGEAPGLLLNDAVTIPGVSIRQVSIIKGDAKSLSIAAASIIAKVTRDRLMYEYDELYPEYGFARNKGYGTADHIAALKKYGPCPIHRHSFIGNFV